ncbi:MAG: trypsin-like peptidase domain-containing protein [Gammaproteobacteria bacterium]|nr:trypsin-like peptidase domain-containing protein [Gammaproteobacteria bacterium]MDP2140208.1 trypsin-like peptidase domain-containing protein [Gammaproteobacteria bacterium]MDP2348084.1 trypsin-like peptidase domain-containing protein [Gammaproteobacteria bacterium]
MKKFLQFISWPTIAGVLFAVILVQYQQINRLGGILLQEPVKPTASAGSALPFSLADAVDTAAPAVVSIHSTIRQQIQLPPPEDIPPMFRNLLQNIPAERSYNSLGSGVIVSNEGHVLTSLHVIEGAEDIEVRFGDLSSETFIRAAQLIGSDPGTDLALLKIEAAALPAAIPIGSSDTVRVGDTVLAIGFPSQELISQKSVSRGIVSALGIPQNGLPIVEYIQTDAAINYGNSGGALVNANGELIGINSFIYSQSGGSDGIGFAVPINKAMVVVDQLIAFGEVTPGYLGVITGEMLTQESSLNFFGRSDVSGLLIEQVNAASPAELAGIKPGDVMIAIDGSMITSVIGAIDQINRKAPGQMVDLGIYREGENLTIPVQLGSGTAQYRIPELPGN